MPKVTYTLNDGTTRALDVATGTSVMQAAVAADVDGIVAECGGSLMCATCHVYVELDWLDSTPPMGDEEDEMLESTACERLFNSRLSCQLVVSEALDGLSVTIPEEQV